MIEIMLMLLTRVRDLVVGRGAKTRHSVTPSPRWGRQSRREGWGEGEPNSIGCSPLTPALSAAPPHPKGRGRRKHSS